MEFSIEHNFVPATIYLQVRLIESIRSGDYA